MKILVTGGAGFLGAYIFDALTRAGSEVLAYDRAHVTSDLAWVANGLPDALIRGEIADFSSLSAACRSIRPDVIVHAAARVGFESSLEDPSSFYQTNVMGFVNVCEVARALDVRKIVLISSNTACHAGVGPVQKETDPAFSITRANPSAHYGTSKMIAEAIGMSYGQFHGIDFLALRVAAVYGFGMRIPLYIKPMVENAVDGIKTTFATGGRMKRDLTHVLDVGRAVAAAVHFDGMQSDQPRVLNVAAGTLVSPAEIARIVRSKVPGTEIEIGDALTPLEEENLKSRVPLDIEMAKNLLDWKPQFQIEDGISQYLATYRNYRES
ncbi:NAD(P)-dependent oxidoreductase [Burkholderia multivorans]|uniref:NAD(P)-dependent oxidoreductase n=1 Tax=Burkholderia multivorans TaxID=87883 RepID=A0AAP2HI62_9BURK|nr:NAD(P)-dependent oxidoreductase [Burkholderia multivorans]MBH9664541.1 NAD(P)-dependent oxidoreductase [Burkholderia multivorans]MBU9356126.1 NAD(P)-dependent oxidoreductase [Burkholderia multivorans]MBU9366482.1 NAD(P)-dependent oxidoreductase [Burkholderia multivorans]MBU9597096.1 NAD(P)-dependent oxidoreductase [Burkholderia multivorans]MBU9651197.1 NAD(P)-dependent oxidoreductase [Burkholderia multivorans]